MSKVETGSNNSQSLGGEPAEERPRLRAILNEGLASLKAEDRGQANRSESAKPREGRRLRLVASATPRDHAQHVNPGNLRAGESNLRDVSSKDVARKKSAVDVTTASVLLVLDEARSAARTAGDLAFDALVRTGRQNADGSPLIAWGSAWVIVYGLSPKLRILLKSMNEISSNPHSMWSMNNFYYNNNKGGAASNIASAKAACKILEERFEKFASFSIHFK